MNHFSDTFTDLLSHNNSDLTTLTEANILEQYQQYQLPPSNLRPHMLQSEEDIKAWLTELDIFDYEIYSDLSVSVWQDVRFNPTFDLPLLSYLPLNFREIKGSFFWSAAHLTTLQGAPWVVSGDFDVSKNSLTTLEYAPKKVGGAFNCAYNKLQTLEGAPQNAVKWFSCQSNALTSLLGAPPKIHNSFNCRDNLLTSLSFSPKEIGSDFDFSNNQISTLEHLPFFGGSLLATENQLTSMEGLPDTIDGDLFIGVNLIGDFQGSPEYVSGNFDCVGNPLRSLKGFRTRIGSHEVLNCPADIPGIEPYYDERVGGIYDYDLEKIRIILEERELMEKIPKNDLLDIKKNHKI